MWKSVKAVRKNLRAAATALDANNQAHRKILAELTPKELVALVAAGASPRELGNAAHELGATDRAATGRIYDALLTAPVDSVGPFVPVNGTFWLLTAIEAGEVDKARIRRYVKRWSPLAKRSTLLYLNLASLHAVLGDYNKVLATLREGIREGDPKLAEQIYEIETPDHFAPLRARAAFKALSKIEPVVPRGLRALHTCVTMRLDNTVTQAAWDCYLESVHDTLGDEHLQRFPKLKHGRRFKTFGRTADDGALAFWERTPKQPLAERPIVIFGSEKISIYARNFDGLLVMIGNEVEIYTLEDAGFTLEGDAKARQREPRFKPNKQFFAEAEKWSPGVSKRKPETEIRAAWKLIPELRAFVRR